MDTANDTSTFEPSSDLIQEEDCNTLLVYLPGFTKEQLKIQLTRKRVLKISGRRPLPNNRWSSFEKDFPVPENCDTDKISAKFEEGVLYVRLPKEEKKLAPAETPQPQKPAEKLPPPSPPAAKIDPPPPPPPPTRPPTPIKPTQTTDEIKQSTAPKDSPKKSDQSKEETRSAEKSSEAEGGRKEKRTHAKEKSGDRKASAVEKREKGSGSGGGGAARVEADYNKLSAASPAARLKAARQQVTNILVLLFVFGLGIYLGKLPWFSKRADQD